MNAKLDNLSELANVLSDKCALSTNILSLFSRFGLGHLLSKLSLEKAQGISAVQLIMSLCLFRISGNTIHSIHTKLYYGLLDTGKNCYYRMMTRASMDWRRLLLGMSVRFRCILRKELVNNNAPTCYIIDDTTLEKTGYCMENISRVFDHVKGECVLGYKLLVLALSDGKSTIPVDFSLHAEKGSKGSWGLTAKQLKNRFRKKRDENQPNYTREKEAAMPKLDAAVEMLRRAWKIKTLRAQYILCDSWFTCDGLISKVRGIGKGALHLVGLAKMGKAKYEVDGKLRNAKELIALYERKQSHYCRKYKCRQISLRGKLGENPVRIYLIKYGRNSKWNILLSTDTSMTFVKAFEIYQMRWAIEVMNKETKQYLGLGDCQGRDFDEQIADCAICFITYMVMVLEKRFSEYETVGKLFTALEDEVAALTLWQRVLDCLARLLEVLCDLIDITAEELAERLINDEKTAESYHIMAKALKMSKIAS